MSTITQTIAQFLKRFLPQSAPQTTATETAASITKWSYRNATLQWLQVERDRYSMVQDCRTMYDNDGRAKSVLSTLARDVVGGGFKVMVNTDSLQYESATAIVDGIVGSKALKLVGRLDDWIRLALRDGDLFLELGVTQTKELAEITAKPALFMRRNTNMFDQFEDINKAFGYSENGFYLTDSEIYFALWQIIHVRANHDEGNRYGTPSFASARRAWKMLTDGEQNMAVNRRHWANRTLVHVLEGADDTAIASYQEANKDALGNPFAPALDFFTNKPGGIMRLDGGSGLGEIKDIQHHLSTWSADSPVPIELLGYGDNVNSLSGDVLQHKKEQYKETLQAFRQWASDEILRPILETAWALGGVYPPNVKYEIIWIPGSAPKSAEIVDAAIAVQNLQATGLLSAEALIDFLMTLLPNIDRAKAIKYLGGNNDESVA